MIAITGANGQLGRATIDFLTAKTKPENILAVVRNAEKAKDLREKGIQIRIADYDDPASIDAAFNGVEKVLQISASGVGENMRTQENNVVKAAAKNGVKHIIYTSTLTPGSEVYFEGAQTCHKTEQAILETGIPYTFFRNSMYFETIPLFIGDALQSGHIYFSSGNGQVSFASRIDMAEALANVLATNAHQHKVYPITGSKAYSFHDLARLITKEKGHEISYVDVPAGALKEEFIKSGMPADEARFYISMANSIKTGEFQKTDNSLEKLLERKPMGIRTYLRTI